jgi:CubicO group peptidase (beta-lactamase class C family)
MNMRKITLIIVFVFYLFSVTAQENKLPVFVTDSLENYITRGMTKWKIPGLSIAIIKDGEVKYIKGFGVTREGGTEPVNENTLFMIGSNTKAFTATTIAILQAEGKLTLNDKVQKWMPEFRLKDSLAGNEIIIADLLSHRIGFETFQGDFTYWTSNLSRVDVIHKMALIDATYNFRTKWGYCNAAFLTAGELIPRITGKSWEETVKEKILVPLNMNRTLMLSNDLKTASNAASPNTIVDGKLLELPVPFIDNLAPAASISSCAKDMAAWVMMHLNNGKINGIQVVPEKAIQAIRSPYTIMGMNPRNKQETHFYLYGLGLFINDRNGKLIYSHTGGVDGFLSSVMFIPEEKVGIVILTNNDQNNFYQNLTNEISDAFLGLPYQDYSDKSFDVFSTERQKSTQRIDSLKNVVKLLNKPGFPLESYTGKYTNEVYGDIEVKIEKNILNIHFSNHPDLIGRLGYLKNDVFLCTYSNPEMGIVEIPFKVDKDKVSGLTLHVSVFVEFTPYIFIKKK